MSKSSNDPLVGRKIREYEILDVIAPSRMGVVYRVRHVFLDEERAMKVIRTGDAPSQEMINRFIREARILAKLNHPNLVKLQDFGTLDESTFFMTMELLHGETLQQRISRDRIPIDEAVRTIRQAALGLQEAHNHGIIHRDVCPANLWVSGNIIKVTGFSIAKPTAEDTNTLTAQLFAPEYQCPEQFGSLQEGETLDQRADIYSLGVTFYEMLSGELPFATPVPRGTPNSLSARIPDLPAGLERLVMKALSLKRENRHSSMQELITDLDSISLDESTLIQKHPQDLPKPRFAPGSVFAGRYLVEKRIGKGGMGTVYKATDKILEIPVAVKTMNSDVTLDEKTLLRFKREVILARKVAHPNVCRIYDIGESEGIHYVSMEYLEGVSLADLLLTRGALAPSEGLKILKQVLEALKEAHRVGIIHRDLKPQNIMVVGDHAYIMDFGISVSTEASTLTATGMMVGTPRYMAPEQFGEGAKDQRCDLYAVGVIMFEMFTGRLPFESNTPAGVMYAHLYTDPPKPSDMVPEFSKPLERIILKTLEKDPQNRYQTANDLLVAIEHMSSPPRKQRPKAAPAAPHPPMPPPPQPPRPLPPQPQRPHPPEPPPEVQPLQMRPASNRGPLIGIILILFFVAAAGAVGIWYWKTRAQTQEVKSEPVATQQPAHVEKKEPTPSEPVSQPAVNTDKKIPNPSEAAVEPAAQGEKKTESVAAPLEEKKTEPIAPPPEEPKPTIAQAEPSQKTEPAPETQKAAAMTPVPAPPVVSGPGRISYSGQFPVSIYNGGKLILNTADSDSIELASGRYSLTLVSKENAIIRSTQNIQVRPGETTAIPEPGMSKLSVSGNPGNCKIYVDTIYLDEAPIFDFPIQAGNHFVKVVWEGLGKEKTVSITVRSGDTMKLQAISNETTTDIFQDAD